LAATDIPPTRHCGGKFGSLEHGPVSNFKSFAVNTLVVLVATVAGLGAIEAGVRLLDLAPVTGPSPTGGLKAILAFDEVLELRYRPNSTTRIASPYGEYDLTYRIGPDGLRDRPLLPKAPTERRVLLLGNSFVEGWGVEEADSFARVAEDGVNGKLSSAGSPAHLRVVNGGISAYGAAQSYLLAKRLWPIVEPDAVVLVLIGTMINADQKFLGHASLDPAGVATGLDADAFLSQGAPASAVESKPLANLFNSAAAHSALIRLVAQRVANRDAIEQIHPGDPETDMLAAYRAGPDQLRGMVKSTLHHAAALADLARQKGKPFLIVHLPMAIQVSTDEWSQGRKAYKLEDRVYDAGETAAVREFCDQNKIACVFADDVIKEAERTEHGRLYFKYDFHFTPLGNRLIGTWLAARLQNLMDSRL
jgi:hypothetical protein